jgi:predicted component of type VI protein secretion system
MKKIGRGWRSVPNRLNEDDTKLNVELNFEAWTIFSRPGSLQVTPLQTAGTARSLANLRSSLIGNSWTTFYGK